MQPYTMQKSCIQYLGSVVPSSSMYYLKAVNSVANLVIVLLLPITFAGSNDIQSFDSTLLSSFHDDMFSKTRGVRIEL